MKLRPGHSAAENARAVLPRMVKKYFEAGREALRPQSPLDELHRFRIATKRLRYTLELFRPVYGPNLDRYLQALRGVQTTLGKLSDLHTIDIMLAGGRALQPGIQRALKQQRKELRRQWRAFDAGGELKRWKTYLAQPQR
jgi:CHAD domain-containing protein